MKYPHPCCRCGFCCLAETCITAQDGFGVGKHDPCPALSFENGLAVCGLAANAPTPAWAEFFIGVGLGCCVKARAIGKDGKEHDFAPLLPALKQRIALNIRRQMSIDSGR